jgi:hypothetical protein
MSIFADLFDVPFANRPARRCNLSSFLFKSSVVIFPRFLVSQMDNYPKNRLRFPLAQNVACAIDCAYLGRRPNSVVHRRIEGYLAPGGFMPVIVSS